MALESVTYISDLNPANPTGADPKSAGDDHIRNIKAGLKNSYPNITGAMTLTHTVLNGLPADIAAKGAISGQTWTGTHNFPATTYGVTATQGSSGTQFATLDYVNAKAFSSVLPAQTGNGGKVLATNGTTAAWEWAQSMPRVARTANTMLVQADRAKLVDITAGTFTQTFDTAANLGDGWYLMLRNSGTGDITIPDSDGRTNWKMYPGEMRVFQCDGAVIRSVVARSFNKQFTTTDTFTKPPGYAYFEGELWGAGGSGAKHSSFAYVSGGAGGGCSVFKLPDALLGTTEAVVIGAPGGAISAANTVGVAGGSSSFGSLITASGGGGGLFSSDNNGATNATSGKSHPNYVSMGDAYDGGSGSGNARRSTYGGGSGGGISFGTIDAGGASLFGGSGGAASDSTAAGNGTGPGAGGGASRTGTSGAGTAGELRIRGIM